MKYEQYQRTLVRHGLGEPDGAVLLHLLGSGSRGGCLVADLSGMFTDDKLLLPALRRLEHDELVVCRFVIHHGDSVFMTDTGRDVAEELFRSATGLSGETVRPLSGDSAARRMDKNLRSVFG